MVKTMKELQELPMIELRAEYDQAKQDFDGMNDVAHDLSCTRGEGVTIYTRANERETRKLLLQEAADHLANVTKVMRANFPLKS